MKQSTLKILTGLVLYCAAALAQAQAYPTKPIRWVVPYGPGSTDILARVVAPKVGAALGQQIGLVG